MYFCTVESSWECVRIQSLLQVELPIFSYDFIFKLWWLPLEFFTYALKCNLLPLGIMHDAITLSTAAVALKGQASTCKH